MTKSTAWLAVVFVIMSLVALGFFLKLLKVEKARKEQAANQDGFQPVANYSAPM